MNFSKEQELEIQILVKDFDHAAGQILGSLLHASNAAVQELTEKLTGPMAAASVATVLEIMLRRLTTVIEIVRHQAVSLGIKEATVTKVITEAKFQAAQICEQTANEVGPPLVVGK